MKIVHKVGLAAAVVLLATLSAISVLQVTQVRTTLRDEAEANIRESGGALARQIENWLNAKLMIVNLMADNISASYSSEQVLDTFNAPSLKNEFSVIFGALESDGKAILNNTPWNPPAGYDGRTRSWFPAAKNSSKALFTEPYADATTGELLISAVARIADRGRFMGAFGGDIELKTIAEAINTMNFNGAGYAFLLNSKGHIISHPDTRFNGKSYSELLDGKSPAINSSLQEARVNGLRSLVSFTQLSQLDGMDCISA